MIFILYVAIIQHGITEEFTTRYTSSKECESAKEEALKHDNEITRVAAFCFEDSSL